jgi:pullulanase/glycogen debranching enzyme
MTVSRGRSFPLGATVAEGGVNFCILSRHASAIELGTIVDPFPLDEQGPRTDASTP